jgi:tight adherence protein C
MIMAFLLGAGFGLGVWAIVRGAYPPRPSLAESLAALHRTPEPTPVVTDGTGGWASRLGRPGARLLVSTGLPGTRTRRDLAVLGRTVDAYLAEKTTSALIGLVLPVACLSAVAATGRQIPVLLPLWAALLCAAIGFMIPDLAVHSEATLRRRDFRHAFSAFLDLVVIALAGGAGTESAMMQAAEIGNGWAFLRLRGALYSAQITGAQPFTALASLGDELGIADLTETAGAVALAGREGAKVRATLATKADSLREHQLADTEAEAASATERMAAPLVMTFVGFLTFLAYPAMIHVLGGL